MPELTSAERVVEALKLPVTAATLRRWANEGRVPATRVSRKVLLFDLVQVAKVLGAQVATNSTEGQAEGGHE